MKDSQPTSMKAIDYATVMAHLTRDDMIHFAKTYVRFVGKDYDSLSSDEQQAWMNAVLVSQFRELHLSQDILEKAMGTEAYDKAVTNADRFRESVHKPGVDRISDSKANEISRQLALMKQERCVKLGFNFSRISAWTSHALLIGIMVNFLQDTGQKEKYEELKERTPLELWDEALDLNRRYAAATGNAA